MTLAEWAAQHPDEVFPEQASPRALHAILKVLARELSDAAGVPSDDGRLEHAFSACLAVARAALLAAGYRLRSSAHHYLAVESLGYTLGLPPAEVRQLQELRRQRARAMYDEVGVASREDAQAALAAARHVADQLAAWLSQQRPDLRP